MRIKNLELTNYRQFKSLVLHFPEDANVVAFIGNNGSGKTSILEALSLSFSSQTNTFNNPAQTIQDLAISHSEHYSAVSVELIHGKHPYKWTSTKTLGEAKAETENKQEGTFELAELFRNSTEETTAQLPLLAYYPVERSASALIEEFSKNEQHFKCLCKTISQFLSKYSNLKIERKPQNQLRIDKNGTTLQIEQLSLGERALIGLAGSIANRLSVRNPTLKNPLKGQGIIMIDALELHLHPNLQGGLIASLCSTFPNCQFILSTNSPLGNQ